MLVQEVAQPVPAEAAPVVSGKLAGIFHCDFHETGTGGSGRKIEPSF
jgi:hypothetical protein